MDKNEIPESIMIELRRIAAAIHTDIDTLIKALSEPPPYLGDVFQTATFDPRISKPKDTTWKRDPHKPKWQRR